MEISGTRFCRKRGELILANKFKRFNKANEEIIVKSENVEGLSSLLANKVSVVTGKQLSTNDFTNTDKSNVSANTSARHTHSNKSIIDKITQTFIDNWTAAYTHISDTVKHITAAERTKWNGAATSQHTHSNKSVLDGITSTLVSNWNSAYTHISDAIKHITATERTNWNSAKSKADAALPASSYTAADILKKLLTVDGSGSKLDADLLDGKEATNFASSTHTHTPASIGAANAKHNHSTLDIVRGGNENWADNIGSTNRAMINTARSPKSAFLPANCITVEYSSDAGKTWEDYGLSEAQKRGLFALTCDNDVRLSKSSPVSTNDCVRITVEPLDRYVSFDQLYIWFSTGSHACTLDLERSTIGAKDTFSFIRKDVPLGGWSGPNVINFPYGTFGGNHSQTSNAYKYRMTFKTTKLGSSTTQFPTIIDIRFYGDRAWLIPNDMVKGDYPFSWDRDMNVNFSEQLKEQGKRVYSDNNKPTPAAIGAATAEQGIKADAALPKSGGTMTGFITLHAAPTANMHPATKKYVDDKMIAAGNGDMTKAVYDANGDGVVDKAETVPWSGVTGKPNTFPPSTHKHTKSEITDFPVSLKNPAALAISLNGTSQGTYDGSVAKSVNITPAGIGALGRTEKAADSSKLAGLTPVVDNPGPSNRNTWYFPFTGTNNRDGTRKYYAALYADNATTAGRASNLSMGLNGTDLWVYYS
nr:MAG TPA: hypothetical protein [Caudoviricetes sp.]